MSDRAFFLVATILAIVMLLTISNMVNPVWAVDRLPTTESTTITFTATVGVGVVVDESISGGTVVFESEPN